MKMIPTKVHGVLDYLTGGALMLAPAIFNFSPDGPAGRVPLVLGIGVILYSLLTRYEWGLVKVIPMPVHLLMDFVGGLFLLVSPWLFGFADEVWMPHVFVGIFEIAAAAMTRRVPDEIHAGHPPIAPRPAA